MFARSNADGRIDHVAEGAQTCTMPVAFAFTRQGGLSMKNQALQYVAATVAAVAALESAAAYPLCQASREEFTAQGLVQKWYYLDCSSPVKQISGTLKGVRLNDKESSTFFGLIDCPGPDGDWNIWLKPKSSDKWSLRNSDNDENAHTQSAPCGVTLPTWDSSPTSLIELEVKSSKPSRGQNLKDYFWAGQSAVARGYWVEDAGHSHKTELHPLTFLTAGTADSFSVFVPQETSGRFYADYYAIDEPIFISLGVEGGKHRIVPTSLPSTKYSHNSAVVLEKYRLDDLWETGFLCGPLSQRNRSSAPMTLGLTGNLTIAVHVPAFSICNSPFYLAAFSRGETGALTETITAKVVAGTWPDQNGTDKTGKRLEVKVDITLEPPPTSFETQIPNPAGLAFSKWSYPTFVGRVQTSNIETRTANHAVSASMVFWPDGGFNQTTFPMYVSGSTAPEDWSTPANATDKTNGPYRRGYVHDRRLYEIQRSRLSLTEKPVHAMVVGKRKKPTSIHGPTESKFCVTGYELIPDASEFISGVNMRGTPTWVVESFRDAAGNSISQTASMASGTTVNVPGAKVQYDGVKVSVSFDDLGWRVQDNSASTPTLLPSNGAGLRIYATAQSELGELTGAKSRDLFEPICPGHFITKPATPVDIVKEGLRALAAIAWMQQRGLLPPKAPCGGPGGLPTLPVAQIAANNPSGLNAVKGLDEVAKQVPAPCHHIVATLSRLQRGEALSENDITVIDAILTTSNKLPPVRIKDGIKLPTPQMFELGARRDDDFFAKHLPTAPIPRTLDKGFETTLLNVRFEKDGSLTESSFVDIARLARRTLPSNQTLEIGVSESASTLKAGALKRAEIIRDALVASGVPKAQVAVRADPKSLGDVNAQGVITVRVK
jgi:hypothetical protein